MFAVLDAYLSTWEQSLHVTLFLFFLSFSTNLPSFAENPKKKPNLADSALKRKQLAFVRGHVCARNDVVSALSHVAYCFFSIIIMVVAGSRDVITSGLPGEKKMAETYKLDCLSSPFLGNPLVERY